VGVGVEVGISTNLGVGVAEGVGRGVAVGVGDGLGVRAGFGVGDGVMLSSLTSSLSEVFADSGFGVRFFAAGEGAGVSSVPGSVQSLVFSPLVKVACKRVPACSLITRPSNFPRTILPL